MNRLNLTSSGVVDNIALMKKAPHNAWHRFMEDLGIEPRVNMPVGETLEALKKRPLMKHIIITGRDCHEKIIDYADLVTEMKLVKHPYKNGIAAQKGIEF